MEIGLECYDADGNKIFDSDLHTSKYLGSGNTGTTSGSLIDSNINNGNVWIVVTGHPEPLEYGDITSKSWKAPRFSVSGNTISWSFDYSALMYQLYDLQFIYGVYI